MRKILVLDREVRKAKVPEEAVRQELLEFADRFLKWANYRKLTAVRHLADWDFEVEDFEVDFQAFGFVFISINYTKEQIG